MSTDARTVFCGNLSDKVTEEILFELFLQAAPLEKVSIPSDREGRKCNYGFVTCKHPESVEYITKLFNGTCLYEKQMYVKPRHNQQSTPKNSTPNRSFSQENSRIHSPNFQNPYHDNFNVATKKSNSYDREEREGDGHYREDRSYGHDKRSNDYRHRRNYNKRGYGERNNWRNRHY